MLHWITLTADMLPEVIDRAELEAITAADTDGVVVDGIIQDVTASVREAIAANPANVMDLAGDTIPRTLKPEALDMIAWRLLKRFAVTVSEPRDKAYASARERLEAVRAACPCLPASAPTSRGRVPPTAPERPDYFPPPGVGGNRQE